MFLLQAVTKLWPNFNFSKLRSPHQTFAVQMHF